MGSPWATVTNVLEKHKEQLVPIAAFTAIGGCVYLCCKFKTFFRSQQQDPVNPVPAIPEKHKGMEILDIPPEIRSYIWDYLSYQDILTLRLVCDDLKNDVDTIVGVKGHLNSRDEESFSFFRSVALRKCCITNLHDLQDENIFASPCHIEHLHVFERTSLSVKTIKRVLCDCNNVKTLVLRFNHHPDSSNFTTPISRIVLNSLRKKLRLKQLQLIKIRSHDSQSDKSCPQDLSQFNLILPNVLNFVHVELPEVSQYHLSEWKYFLEQQSMLQTIMINFGGLPWQFFKGIIPKNQNTLKFIFLDRLKSFDSNAHEDFPFDWGLFKDCTNLEGLQITGHKYLDNMSSINFSSVPAEKLQQICIKRVVLTRAEVTRIYKEMPAIKHGTFENLGREGDNTAAELMIEIQQAEAERDLQEWEESQRFVEIFSEIVFHFCVFGIFTAYSTFFYFYYIRNSPIFHQNNPPTGNT